MDGKKKEIFDKLESVSKLVGSFTFQDPVQDVMWVSRVMGAQENLSVDFFDRAINKLQERVTQAKKDLSEARVLISQLDKEDGK